MVEPVSAERSDRGRSFHARGLRSALEHDLAELGSTAGFLVKDMLPADPTGEMLHLIEQQQSGGTDPIATKAFGFRPTAAGR